MRRSNRKRKAKEIVVTEEEKEEPKCSICAVGVASDPRTIAALKKKMGTTNGSFQRNVTLCAESAAGPPLLLRDWELVLLPKDGQFIDASVWIKGISGQPGHTKVIKLPLRLVACCGSKECRQWATPALAGLFAQAEGGTSVEDMTAEQLAGYNANIALWHSWVAINGAAGRSTLQMTKNLKGKHWKITVNALYAAFAAAEEDGGLPEFMEKSRGAALLRGAVAPTALKKHVDEWGEKFLGPAWRLYAQMMHWQLQTPRMDYLKEAAPRGAVRPITCLVIEMLLRLEFPGESYAEKMTEPTWIATHVAPGLNFIGFNALVKVGKDFKKTNGRRGGKETPEKKRKREKAAAEREEKKRTREEKAAERQEKAAAERERKEKAAAEREEEAAATERAVAACLAQAEATRVATGCTSRFFGVSWNNQHKKWNVRAASAYIPS